MIYVLDTDILSLLGHKDSPEAPRIRRRIAELPAIDAVVTTAVNFEEQMRGWMSMLSRARSMRAEVAVYRRLVEHLATFRRMTVLEFGDQAADIAEHLRTRRLRVGTMDLKIAAITMAAGGTLVTRNAADFGKIPDLAIEDWSEENPA